MITAVLLATAVVTAACGTNAPTPLQGDASAQAGENSPAALATPEVNFAETEVPTPALTDSSLGANSDEADDGPDGTQIELSDTVKPAPTPTPKPSVVAGVGGLVVATGGAVDTLTNVEFTVGATTSTTGDLASFIAGTPEPAGDKHWLVTELWVESTSNIRWVLREGNFALVSPDGTVHAAEATYDNVNQRTGFDLVGREFRSGRVAFATNGPVTDATGWNLHVSGGDVIPLVMPLTGSAYDHAYPVNLPDGFEAQLTIEPNSLGCGNGSVFSTKIAQSSVRIEEASSETRRAPATERYVAIDLVVTNKGHSQFGNDNCGLVGLWPDFILNVDGRPTQPFTFERPDIEGFASVNLDLVFQIPSTATSIELVGGDDKAVLGQWKFELPLAVGEVGAPLVPFGKLGEPVQTIPAGPRPKGLTTTVIAEGEATGNFLLTNFAVRDSTATNAGRDSFVKGAPALSSEDRTWLIVGVDVETTAGIRWNIGEENFVLEDPAGRPYGSEALYDRIGDDEGTLYLDGLEYHDLRVAFETDGLVTDPTGWNLRIDNGDQIPMRLPLSGPAPDSQFPVDLDAGTVREVPADAFPNLGCNDGGLLEVSIEQGAVAIEESTRNNRIRVEEPDRIIALELKVTSLQSDALGNANCGLLGLWPEFLLNVDGRITQAYSYDKPSLDQFETAMMPLRFLVPKETQRVALVGGSGQTVIATFELKSGAQVLTDLGAARVDDDRTLITLDETLLFAFGESTLQQSAIAPLTRVANVVSDESSGAITVVGHTDAIGDDASNQELSLARAEAVVAALVEAGVDAARLVVSGEGESSPVAPNDNSDGSDNPAGRAQNRRVEIFFTAVN